LILLEEKPMPSSAPGTDIPHLLARINSWLAQIDAGIGNAKSLAKISIGQSNPTYRLKTDKGRFILRMQPPGDLLPSAHAVDREYRVMEALQQTPVPVPRMIALCDDKEVAGVKFFIMEEMTGEVFMDPGLAALDIAARGRVYDAQIDILAALAGISPQDIGLHDFGRPSGYLERQITIWTKQYRSGETDHLDAMEYLIETLPGRFADHQPGLCVVHGDFRLDNLIIDTSAAPKVSALIDWELSTLGPPFVDLSYLCAMLRMPADLPIGGLGGLDRQQQGLPTEKDMIARFCAHTGLGKPQDWEIWIAFQLFRFAAILQGVWKRHLDGNASAENAAAVGDQRKPVAALAAATLKEFLAS